MKASICFIISGIILTVVDNQWKNNLEKQGFPIRDIDSGEITLHDIAYLCWSIVINSSEPLISSCIPGDEGLEKFWRKKEKETRPWCGDPVDFNYCTNDVGTQTALHQSCPDMCYSDNDFNTLERAIKNRERLKEYGMVPLFYISIIYFMYFLFKAITDYIISCHHAKQQLEETLIHINSFLDMISHSYTLATTPELFTDMMLLNHANTINNAQRKNESLNHDIKLRLPDPDLRNCGGFCDDFPSNIDRLSEEIKYNVFEVISKLHPYATNFLSIKHIHKLAYLTLQKLETILKNKRSNTEITAELNNTPQVTQELTLSDLDSKLSSIRILMELLKNRFDETATQSLMKHSILNHQLFELLNKLLKKIDISSRKINYPSSFIPFEINSLFYKKGYSYIPNNSPKPLYIPLEMKTAYLVLSCIKNKDNETINLQYDNIANILSYITPALNPGVQALHYHAVLLKQLEQYSDNKKKCLSRLFCPSVERDFNRWKHATRQGYEPPSIP